MHRRKFRGVAIEIGRLQYRSRQAGDDEHGPVPLINQRWNSASAATQSGLLWCAHNSFVCLGGSLVPRELFTGSGGRAMFRWLRGRQAA